MKKNSISTRQKEKCRPREIKVLLLSAIPQPWGGEVVQIAEHARRAYSDCAVGVRESRGLIRFVLKGGFDGLRFLYRRTVLQALNLWRKIKYQPPVFQKGSGADGASAPRFARGIAF